MKSQWESHYHNLGLNFPNAPINGVLWIIWSLSFTLIIFSYTEKYSLIPATILSWFSAFVLMWVVIGNLGVLPFKILPIAIPLSLLETFIAVIILKQIFNSSH